MEPLAKLKTIIEQEYANLNAIEALKKSDHGQGMLYSLRWTLQVISRIGKEGNKL